MSDYRYMKVDVFPGMFSAERVVRWGTLDGSYRTGVIDISNMATSNQVQVQVLSDNGVIAQVRLPSSMTTAAHPIQTVYSRLLAYPVRDCRAK